ncbi:hypothetical protein A8F94_14000 [Bacillus sp. FJAT-27225]|nr:hypothetical protein A8F94_14000 [Bacillus sp. FJAT-27225]
MGIIARGFATGIPELDVTLRSALKLIYIRGTKKNNLIETEGAKTPVGAAGQVRPHRRLRRGGSPPAPRKAKRL